MSYMKSLIKIKLVPPQELAAQLFQLQTSFADACNMISEVAANNKCWNRVTLHHLVYHDMRDKFSELGSQMVCNAIYAVSRAYRIVHAQQLLKNSKLGPTSAQMKIAFLPSSPVFFDKKTMSLTKNKLSLFTMQGRIYFDVQISKEDQETFLSGKIKEVTLQNQGEAFFLNFHFSDTEKNTNALTLDRVNQAMPQSIKSQQKSSLE